MESEEDTSKGSEGLPPWVTGPLAFLLALGTVGAAVMGLLQQLKDPEKRNQLLIGAFAVLLFGGLAFLWKLIRKRLGPASSFAHPDKLKIGQKYLYGREDEIRSLRGRLKDYPLVFLVGESGAGKSSLLERGLAPQLAEEALVLPVYLNHWGADWIEGPRRTLADVLSQSLHADLREKLEIKGPVTAEHVFPLLARLHDELGYRPILLLDQFDDYQARHRDRFLRGPDRKVLRAPELLRENPFWKDLEDLLRADKLRCLVATRDDAQWGLESVRFQEPGIYLLPLLEREHAAALLDAVAAEAGVKEPERGFRQLRDRLLLDLAPEGLVLPIQMKAVLQGLAELQPLNLVGYTREGGLSGLQALSIARAIAQAARQAGLPTEVVRRLLVGMVAGQAGLAAQMARLLVAAIDDPDLREKTMSHQLFRFLGDVPAEHRDEKKLEVALSSLREDDVVRFRANPDLGTSAWQLDHDYLCRGVLELDRRARRWPLLLEESSQSFSAAHGLRARWRNLLSPPTQMRLLWERVRGRLTYGRARAYAGLSVLRFVGNVWVPLVAVGLFVASAYPAWRAAKLFESFSSEERLNRDEAKALWHLTYEREAVLRALLEEPFKNQSKAERFSKPGDFILHAAMGLNEDRASRLLRNILSIYCSRPYPEDYFIGACYSLAWQLPASGENAEFYFNLTKTNPKFSGAFAPRLLEMLSTGSRGQAVAELAARIAAEKEVEKIQGLAQELLLFRDYIPVDVAEELVGRLLHLREERSGGGLIRPIVGLMPRLPAASFRRSFYRLEALRDCGRSPDVWPGDDVFLAVPETLRASLAGQAKACIEKETRGRSIRAIRIFGKFHKELPLAWKRDAASKLVSLYDPSRKMMDGSDSGFESFVGYLPASEQAMIMENFSIDVESLPNFPLSREASAILVSKLLYDINSGDLDKGSALYLQAHLFVFARNLSDAELSETAQRLLDGLLSARGDTYKIRFFSEALGSLEKDIPVDIARKASSYLLDLLLDKESSSSRIRSMATALAAFGRRLPEDIANQATEHVLSMLDKDSTPPSELIQALGMLGAQASPAVHKKASQRFFELAKSLAKPPCSMAAPLLRNDDETLRQFVDLFKWPTCSSYDLGILSQRLEDITGRDFYQSGPWLSDEFAPWEIARWAEEKGWDPTTPSPAPDILIVSPIK